jgi:hypothetical protein
MTVRPARAEHSAGPPRRDRGMVQYALLPARCY